MSKNSTTYFKNSRLHGSQVRSGYNTAGHCCMLFQTVLRDPLPPPLAKDDEFRKQDYYRTTTGTTHDNKYLETAYKPDVNPIYKKAPGHWKVEYVKDVHEKV